MTEFLKTPYNYEEGSPSNEEPVDESYSDKAEYRKPLEIEKKPASTATPEKKEILPERITVQSFAELMIRGMDAFNQTAGRRVRTWDVGVEEGLNTRVEPNLKYQHAVSRKNDYIDGTIFKVRMPYDITIISSGPDLNREGGKVQFLLLQLMKSLLTEIGRVK